MQLKKISGVDFTLASFIATISIILSLMPGCQGDKPQGYSAELRKCRKEKHKSFLSSGGPLSEGERANFVGLNYFPPDTSFIIDAVFNLNSAPDTIELQTNTDRKPQYLSLGTLEFTIRGQPCQLTLYQPTDPQDTTLFLPFTDATNGIKTYYTGRYLDIYRSNISDTIVLDFNKAYNPYCAYSDRYSCPIPPKPNRLSVEISAGEKLYKSNH